LIVDNKTALIINNGNGSTVINIYQPYIYVMKWSFIQISNLFYCHVYYRRRSV